MGETVFPFSRGNFKTVFYTTYSLKAPRKIEIQTAGQLHLLIKIMCYYRKLQPCGAALYKVKNALPDHQRGLLQLILSYFPSQEPRLTCLLLLLLLAKKLQAQSIYSKTLKCFIYTV